MMPANSFVRQETRVTRRRSRVGENDPKNLTHSFPTKEGGEKRPRHSSGFCLREVIAIQDFKMVEILPLPYQIDWVSVATKFLILKYVAPSADLLILPAGCQNQQLASCMYRARLKSMYQFA